MMAPKLTPVSRSQAFSLRHQYAHSLQVPDRAKTLGSLPRLSISAIHSVIHVFPSFPTISLVAQPSPSHGFAYNLGRVSTIQQPLR